MLFIVRAILAILYGLLVCILGSFYCLLSPRNPRHVARFAHLFARMSTLFGIKVEQRLPPEYSKCGHCIYIANHQNNYDMVTTAKIVSPGTITVGKKSLIWIPLFGPLYWLTGNLLIDRDDRKKARRIIHQIVEYIKKNYISILMFPEGTRSRGRGLLPFKLGAFHAAIEAGVPIVPVCVSNTHHIDLNRWFNGWVIVEALPPIDTRLYKKENVRALSDYCFNQMKEKIEALDKQVAERMTELLKR